ncbi:MAG: hypothetical protein Q4D22_03275 [Candidatus Saccharibacteria bacterium]|nr:hypothetical protein [Candidatus Saccharibacteria bacterium]
MPNKKTSKVKKTQKTTPEKVRRNEKVVRRLHISGLMMMIASVFMVVLPHLYASVYRYVLAHTGLPNVDYMMNFCIAAGEIIAITYFLIGLFVFRAGENGTYLAKGMLVFNSIMAFLSVMAAVLVFMPFPDQTFAYAMNYYNSGAAIETGMIPMAILTLVDMAFIVGILMSVAAIDDICIIKEKK